MASIIIREYGNFVSYNGDATVAAGGVLITDQKGLPIKVVTAVTGVAIDSPVLEGVTNIVELLSDTDCFFAIRPAGLATMLSATPRHRQLIAGSTMLEVVPPGGAIINFLAA